jgi:hypothetical protein
MYMKSKKMRATAGLMVLLIAVLGLGGTASGQVLCIGFDGHLGLEIGTNGVCGKVNTQASRASTQTFLASYEDSHCGQCVDREISATLLVQNLSSLNYLAITSPATQFNTSLDAAASHHQSQEPWLAAYTQLKPIRPTTLLI